jgi:hypothetical protein
MHARKRRAWTLDGRAMLAGKPIRSFLISNGRAKG